MIKKLLFLAFALFLILSCAPQTTQQASSEDSSPTSKESSSKKIPSLASFTEGMAFYEGFFNYYWDQRKAKLYLEVDKLNVDFLYYSSLPMGVGSNDIGLDRGQLGPRRIVRFIRRADRVFLYQPNLDYRSSSEDEAERKSVEEAFASSILAGFDIKAQQDWSVLIDASDFLIRDAHGIAQRLKSRGQGSYSLDKDRSIINMAAFKNFPNNTEINVLTTFEGKAEGAYVRSVVADPEAITLSMQHSFVQLPSYSYRPRKFDPRTAINAISFKDYSAPIGEDMEVRYMTRHRLEKKDPDAKISEAREPIIYYVDRGAPEPVRSALIEGASWWNEAFEALGYKNAFQVKLLPEDADPMDIRYNVIQWVHRATRGWSYGASVTNPLTGEILKGHVTLGSLRVRQDYLIAEALLAPYEEGDEVPEEIMEMALARIRQLSAHEVGHTLGIAHNFAASISDRASVMDYPHPKISVDANGKLSLSDAYTEGLGKWDVYTIAFAYQDFDPENEEEELDKLIRKAQQEGLRFITDQDARPEGGLHPYAHLWDNGRDAVEEMEHLIKVRAIALKNFSEKVIKKGRPMAALEESLVPVYLLHRYQTEALVKLVGGMDYSYQLRGDGQAGPRMLEAKEQKRAFQTLLSTMQPEFLSLPEDLIRSIPPRPFRIPRDRETFPNRTLPAFDPLSAAESSLQMTLDLLFAPQRLNRLVEYQARDASQPGLAWMLEELKNHFWESKSYKGFEGLIHESGAMIFLDHLIGASQEEALSSSARSLVWGSLAELEKQFRQEIARGGPAVGSRLQALQKIQWLKENPIHKPAFKPIPAPPGAPIGQD